MVRNPEQAAYACAALWIVHTVDCAAYARRMLTGTPTPEGEPAPADEVEGRLLMEFATHLTERLHVRARQLGLDPVEVEAGKEAVECFSFASKRADYAKACSFVGGGLA